MAKTLLIVDDEADFGTFVSKVAEKSGYKAVVISDPRVFKETYDQLRPDVIVLDIVMPDLDGIEIMNWLVSVGNKASVVIISGFAPDYAQWARTIGSLGGSFSISALSKPVSVAELSAALGA